MSPRKLPDDDPVNAIEWADPPPRRVRYDWETVAAKLRKRPMTWAKVFEQGRTSQVNAIRQGSVSALHPDLGFEVRTTNNVRWPVRLCDLYLRFNPDKVQPLRSTLKAGRKG